MSPRCWPGWLRPCRRSARRADTMQSTSRRFSANARRGLADANLQSALAIMTERGFPLRRAEVVARLPEFEALREVGREIKDHTLAHLDFYLETYEENVTA